MIETSRRFVNTWECDENAHMNVQFYFAQFEEADPHFWIAAGLPDSGPAVTSRHVRFHREVHASDMTVIRSRLVRHDDGGAALLHMMARPDGILVATCLARLAGEAPVPQQLVGDLPAEARPRSIEAPGEAPGGADAAAAGFLATYRSIVLPRDCDAAGRMTAQMHVARFTDAAGHFWDHIGLEKSWLNAHNFGRVAVEMRLSHLHPVGAGVPIVVHSGLIGFGRKTITFRHYIVDARSGRALAAGDVTGVTIDLDTRRSVSWPEDRLARLAETQLRA